jgi:uncharacterized protein (DUF1330 family)|tara:strand:- start:5107 stop:5397 length:291 start_codon:yes stop_codon:yes gene_type:complete
MPHYLIAQIDIKDREKYAKYEAGFMDIFLTYKGKILSVEENEHLLEGQWPFTRTVLIEFPSQEDALDWYSSKEYQVLVQHRFAASIANIVIISGLN